MSRHDHGPLHRLIDLVRNQERPGADSNLHIVVGAGTVSIGFGDPEVDHDFIPGISRHLANDDSSYQSMDELAQGVLDEMAEQALKSAPQKPAPPKRRRR
jgi:hypothetical protein